MGLLLFIARHGVTALIWMVSVHPDPKSCTYYYVRTGALSIAIPELCVRVAAIALASVKAVAGSSSGSGPERRSWFMVHAIYPASKFLTQSAIDSVPSHPGNAG